MRPTQAQARRRDREARAFRAEVLREAPLYLFAFLALALVAVAVHLGA